MLDIDYKDVTDAIDNLVNCIGVKPDISSSEMLALLKRGEHAKCAQLIATHLGLPIKTDIHIVRNSADFPSHSTEMLRYGDKTGLIAAQVAIPGSLPMLGKEALKGYVIDVFVSRRCCDHPYTFIALLAHELSHILLTSISSRYRTSELHVDLTPLLLGFCNITKRGRITEEKETQLTFLETITTTRTFKYGYLSDDLFSVACSYRNEILRSFIGQKLKYLKNINVFKYIISDLRIKLQEYRASFLQLDSKLPKKMDPKSALRLVHLHAIDETVCLEKQINEADFKNSDLYNSTINIDHFCPTIMEKIGRKYVEVKNLIDNLSSVDKQLSLDIKMIRHNLGCFRRIVFWINPIRCFRRIVYWINQAYR